MNSNLVAIDARLAGGESTGDSTYWTGLLHGLAELDSSLEFLLFSNGERPVGIPKIARFRWITLKSSQSRWWSLVRFPLAARRMGAKAIHTQYNLSPLAGKAGITTIHDVSFFVGPQWFKPKDLFLLKKFVPASAKRAAKVVTVSHTSGSEIRRYIPEAKDKVEVALLGPNPNLFCPPKDQALEILRKEIGLEPPFLLTVSTRWPRKNMALAVKATSGLSSSFPQKLILTGKSGWGEETRDMRAVFTGYVEHRRLSALYAAADLYLAPSFHEGFGLPVLEAFSIGCPVLCSSGGALPEVAGDAALVMKSWEAADWTKAIEELLSDSSKLESMREMGKKRAKVHENVYREVIR
jgi:glycosyltransferase involved in cell wall biosynthesis